MSTINRYIWRLFFYILYARLFRVGRFLNPLRVQSQLPGTNLIDKRVIDLYYLFNE
jgi:hypothetical protein